VPGPFTRHSPLPALGMSSLVLGVLALVLAILPVLGIPVSAAGLLLGLAGLVASFFVGNSSRRWSLAGLAVCSLALATNLAIAYAPGHDPVGGRPTRLWQVLPDRPFVSPPARGEMD
jgi:hypothetical protein